LRGVAAPLGKDTPGVNVTLVLVQEDGSKRPVPMKKQRLVIGRKPECSIRVPVPSVSREHCEVVLEGEKVIVRDLGSSNGTYVNRERVREAQLNPGDLLAVGPAVFVTVIDGKPIDVNAKQSFTAGRAPEPAAAARAPAGRPAAPGKTAAAGAAASKPKTKSLDDELESALSGADLDDSSISDLDFDFLNEEDEDQKKL
jgi:predicted component of type VI protein secretion system